jgi:hypothetical protein
MGGGGRGATRATLPARAGHNRFLWDLRHEGAWDANPARSGANGPLVAPGRYRVRLKVGDWSDEAPLEVKIDPRVAAAGVTQADLEEQERLNLEIRDTIGAARRLAARIDQTMPKASGAARSALERARARLVTAGGAYPQPMLIDQLLNLYRMTGSADQKVGRSAFAFLQEQKRLLAELTKEVDGLAVR